MNSIYDGDHLINCTVAKNFAFKGKYMPSQLYENLFVSWISTGTPVILLQSVIFKIFGINHFLTYIVPMLFSIFVVISSAIFIGIKNKIY